MDIFSGLVIMSISGWECPTGKFFNIGSCRVLEKIPGSGSGLGQVGVLKYMIKYFWVFFYSQVFLGISGYFWLYRIYPMISSEAVSQISIIF